MIILCDPRFLLWESIVSMLLQFPADLSNTLSLSPSVSHPRSCSLFISLDTMVYSVSVSLSVYVWVCMSVCVCVCVWGWLVGVEIAGYTNSTSLKSTVSVHIRIWGEHSPSYSNSNLIPIYHSFHSIQFFNFFKKYR